MLCEIPWGACPFSRKVSQAKRISCCCATLFFPCFLRWGKSPRYRNSMSTDLAHCFAAGDQCVGDLRDMHALKRDGELIFSRLA